MWATRGSPSILPATNLESGNIAANTGGRSGTNGRLTLLAIPAAKSERTATPEVGTFANCEGSSNSLAAARQLKEYESKLRQKHALPSSTSGNAKCVIVNRHELDEGLTNGSEENDENVVGEKEQSIRTSGRSLRSLIDNHKSWSERRREIIVDFRNAGESNENRVVQEIDCLDSLNYIHKRVEEQIDKYDCYRVNGTSQSIKLAAKFNKDKKKQEESSNGGTRQQADQQTRLKDIEREEVYRDNERKEEEAAVGKQSGTGDSESSGESSSTNSTNRTQHRDQEDRGEEQRAKGTRPPTFGLKPHKTTRLPYFSYYGKARNVDLVSSANRSQGEEDNKYTGGGSEDSRSAGSSAADSGSVSSLASSRPSKIPTLGPSTSHRYQPQVVEAKPEKLGRKFLSYSNISNLFPSKLMNIGSNDNSSRWDNANSANNKSGSKQFRFGSEERAGSRSGAPHIEQIGNKVSQGRASRLAPSGASFNRRNSNSKVQHQQQQQVNNIRNKSLNSLNTASPVSPAGVGMRRQNSTSFGINGSNNAQPAGAQATPGQTANSNLTNKYTRPASVAGGAMGRHQRSPSANSLHYPRSGGGGGSAGLSPYGAPPPVDPDCPVHGYWPLSKSQQQLASAGQPLDQWDQPELLYDPYPAQPFMRDPYENPARAQLYSPGGGGATNLGYRPTAVGKRPLNSGAYYNNSSRFSLYHSPSMGDGQRSSLAPASEQVRRILGYQPHTRPIHLHPQWAYSRPFIHLMGNNARSPSPLDIDDLDANGQPIIRPRYELYNQLSDSQAIRAVDFHPSGEVYAVGSNSRTLRICAYPADYELRHFSPSEHVTQAPRVLFKFLQLHRGSIYCVAFNSQGHLLATGSNDQTVQIVRYNSTTHSPDGDEYRLTMHDGTVRDLCFIDDQTSGSSLLLSAGGGDNKIYVTDCDTITPFQSMAGHTQPVMALHHWGGANFVSASQDRTLRFWDLRTRACTSIVSAPPAAAIMGAGQSGTAIKQTSGWGVGPGAPVCSVKVDPSGRLMASGHSDSVCMLYDIRGARIIQAFKPHEDEIRTVNFSPKSYYLLTGGYDGRIVLSDLQGDLTQPLPQCCVAESDDKIVQSKWHPTDFTFVTTSADKTASLWALPAE